MKQVTVKLLKWARLASFVPLGFVAMLWWSTYADTTLNIADPVASWFGKGIMIVVVIVIYGLLNLDIWKNS